MTNCVTASPKLFFTQINSYLNKDDIACVKDAFEFARQEHGNQRRRSGELFFTHPLTVAYYLATFQLDAPALVAALLHDIAEDTRISIQEIEQRFGADVALLVDGVTKLKDVTAGVHTGKKLSPQEIQAATLQKLLRIMTKDVRTVIIKLFDRLHNMRTIGAMPEAKQLKTAKETLSIYAPLANRLGIWNLKNELEALSLAVIDAEAYKKIETHLEKIEQEHTKRYQAYSNEIFECLLNANIDVRNVLLNPQNIYNIYVDQKRTDSAYQDIGKTLRLVVLLSDWPACYQALGYLHNLWQPVPGKFDDYVAVPRHNLYRSLHTTVVHKNGQHIKLHLRTVAMDKVSEIGVLTRWLYAGTPLWSTGIAERVQAFFDNIKENINIEPQDPTTGVKGVVEDVLRHQIRVYTPHGDIMDLGQGATPLDFAYKIHTGLGHSCQLAYVNDLPHALNKPLQDGDTVKIVKRTTEQPLRSWLDENLGYVATNYARTHIRRWFRRLPVRTALRQGAELLETELKMLALSDYTHEKVAELFEYEHKEMLYHDMGRAELLPTVVATRILANKWTQGVEFELDNPVYNADGEKFIITNADGRYLRLCATCQPRPRDEIVGFVRKDHGVTVHKSHCKKIRLEKVRGRLLKLGWGEASQRRARLIGIQIDVYDRPGLLYEITQIMQEEKINITFIHTPPNTRVGEMRILFTLEIIQPRQLVRVLHQIFALANVYSVCCLEESAVTTSKLLPAQSLYRPE